MKMNKKVIFSELSISVYSLIICSIFVIIITINQFGYNKGFFENITVEAHGMLMDLAVIGVLSLWLNNKVRRKDINRGYLEQIDDFRFWKSEEASFRIAGLIKRLNRNGENKIDIYQCFIRGIRLESIKLKDANCFQTNFNKSTLKNVDFINCKLKGSSFYNVAATNTIFKECFMRIVKLQNATMTGVVFEDCDLIRSDFTESDLKGSIFTESDIENAIFKGANLENTNFTKVKNIKIEQILKASSIKSIKLDSYLLDELSEKYPNKVIRYTNKNGKTFIKVK